MNLTSFKRSPVLKDHVFFVPKVMTSYYRVDCITLYLGAVNISNKSCQYRTADYWEDNALED